MRRIRSKDMLPEIKVRRLIHRMGYRYRLHVPTLPGKPDLVFPSRQKVILVHGCFWHQHRSSRCKIARMPKSNLDYWKPKLEKNQVRDANNRAKLRRQGWSIMVIWECQTDNLEKLSKRIERFLNT
jgi:DNA mismatch endonuclease (patch repair protein)